MNDDQRRWREETIERSRQLQTLTDHELIAAAPGPKDDRYPMPNSAICGQTLTDESTCGLAIRFR
jgi:hypothetical protein